VFLPPPLVINSDWDWDWSRGVLPCWYLYQSK
jgi:hypothetical protein